MYLQCGVLERYSQKGQDNDSINVTIFPGKNSSCVNGLSTEVHWKFRTTACSTERYRRLRKSVLCSEADFGQNPVNIFNILPRKLRHIIHITICMRLGDAATLPIATQLNNPISLCGEGKDTESMMYVYTQCWAQVKDTKSSFPSDPQNTWLGVSALSLLISGVHSSRSQGALCGKGNS